MEIYQFFVLKSLKKFYNFWSIYNFSVTTFSPYKIVQKCVEYCKNIFQKRNYNFSTKYKFLTIKNIKIHIKFI